MRDGPAGSSTASSQLCTSPLFFFCFVSATLWLAKTFGPIELDFLFIYLFILLFFPFLLGMSYTTAHLCLHYRNSVCGGKSGRESVAHVIKSWILSFLSLHSEPLFLTFTTLSCSCIFFRFFFPCFFFLFTLGLCSFPFLFPPSWWTRDSCL